MKRFAGQWEIVAAVVAFGAIMTAAVIFQSPMEGHDRLRAIRSVWHIPLRHADKTKTGCPKLSTLEAILPELRGVERAERDYVGWLEGVRC